MHRKIKTFADGSLLEFDHGVFDAWCVFLHLPTGNRKAVTDKEVFSALQEIGSKYGKLAAYEHFVEIFEQTTMELAPPVLESITLISQNYEPDSLAADRLFTILYAGMVAEENKERAILKKKIKRLGVHQLLVEDRDPEYAAHFSRGKKVDELIIECRVRGF